MSNLWPRFTKDNPCPACGHWDWTCRAGDKKFLCQRVQSDHPAADGGFYHNYGDTPIKYAPLPARQSARPLANIESINQQFQRNCVGDLLNRISIRLGVSGKSLIKVGIGYCPEHDAYTFPMFDGDGKVIGIRMRNDEGAKWALRGSRGGIFIPDCEINPIALICEGPTDTAALLEMGFYAIGRPSCNSGGEQIKACLKRLGIRRCVIVSDNDQLKQFGNREARPGVEGAMRLKKEIGISSAIWIPTGRVKDVREFLNFVGAEAGRRIIQDDISKKVWSKV